MRKGIVFDEKLTGEALASGGFSRIELPWELKDRMPAGLEPVGIMLRLRGLDQAQLRAAIGYARQRGAEYLLFNTCDVDELETMVEVVQPCLHEIDASGLSVYIENGVRRNAHGGYIYGPFSEILDLRGLAAFWNRQCERPCFSICLNVGYANVLAKNLRVMAEEGVEDIGLLHMNDNDGFHDEKQIPYSFTTGRGGKGTDLSRMMGIFILNHYGGDLVFDVEGMINRTPERLLPSFTKLLSATYDAWEREMTFEEKVLNQPDKVLLLFGAGNMARDFLRTFGHKYWPEFLVDNNPQRWGKLQWDLEVHKPEDLLSVPAECRNVVLCCMYYDAIGRQLDQMGVDYECFWDQYYI
jgi:hypothetical protein